MPVVRTTAVCEIAGAVGLFVPWLLGVGKVLTPVAAGFVAAGRLAQLY